MSISQSDLDGFHQFASQALAHPGADVNLDELVRLWNAQRERAETVASVRRGVDDANAGRMRDIAEVDAAIRGQLGFPGRR